MDREDFGTCTACGEFVTRGRAPFQDPALLYANRMNGAFCPENDGKPHTFEPQPVDPATTFIEKLDDLRNAVFSLGYHDEGSTEQADAVLQLSEGLFAELTEAARLVINPNSTGGAA